MLAARHPAEDEAQYQASLASRVDSSSVFFTTACELAPDDPYLRTNLSVELQKAGKQQQAKEAFAKAKTLQEATKKANPSAAN